MRLSAGLGMRDGACSGLPYGWSAFASIREDASCSVMSAPRTRHRARLSVVLIHDI